LPGRGVCADASSCPLCVAHQLTAPMVVGPVGLWATRRVVHKSTGGCRSGSRSQFGVIMQISVLVVIGEARGPWKIANRPSGYSCTHTMARTKCGRSGLGGICRVSPRHLTVLPLPTLRSSWISRGVTFCRALTRTDSERLAGPQDVRAKGGHRPLVPKCV